MTRAIAAFVLGLCTKSIRYTHTAPVVVPPKRTTSAERAVRRAEFVVDGWGDLDACWLADTLTGAGV